MRSAVLSVAFIAALGALKAADFSASDDPWASLAFCAVCVVFGFCVGRWWAIGLSLVVPLAVIVHPPWAGELNPGWLAVASVFTLSALVGIGVGLSRYAEQRRSGAPPASGV